MKVGCPLYVQEHGNGAEYQLLGEGAEEGCNSGESQVLLVGFRAAYEKGCLRR